MNTITDMLKSFHFLEFIKNNIDKELEGKLVIKGEWIDLSLTTNIYLPNFSDIRIKIKPIIKPYIDFKGAVKILKEEKFIKSKLNEIEHFINGYDYNDKTVHVNNSWRTLDYLFEHFLFLDNNEIGEF